MPRKTPASSSADARALLASMRPRPDAAENAAPERGADGFRRGFNEAAARCRGKLAEDGATARASFLLQ